MATDTDHNPNTGKYRVIKVGHWIDGSEVSGVGPPQDVTNPASGEVVGQFSEASPGQVEDAVRAAGRAFRAGDWSRAGHLERAETLRKIATLIRSESSRLASLQGLETGAPPDGIQRQISEGAGWFDYFADFLTREGGEVYRQVDGAMAFVEREPIGVAALFSPWTAPVGLLALRLAPALAAGNSVVVKPAEETPLVTRAFVNLIQGAGLPSGVVNVVNGRSAVTGAALASADGVDMISFTGGQAAGQSVAAAAARRFVPCVTDLGGKSATIIFEDADLANAIPNAVATAFTTSEGTALAGARLLVHHRVAEEVIAAFAEQAKALRVGDPETEAVDIGPLISAAHKDRVMGFFSGAEGDGDKVLFGGPDDPSPKTSGHFVRPGAVLARNAQSRIWKEEVYGPVVAIATFTTTDEAVTMANDGDLGLSGYVWTRDLNLALDVSRRLRTGTVVVNAGYLRDLNAPFGGGRQVGMAREGGVHSWMHFTRAKTTVIRPG